MTKFLYLDLLHYIISIESQIFRYKMPYMTLVHCTLANRPLQSQTNDVQFITKI